MMISCQAGLAKVLLKRVLPLFGRDPLNDPWWWPVGTGRTWEDFFGSFLTVAEVERITGLSENELMHRVRESPEGKKRREFVHESAYATFKGYWGEASVCGSRVVAIVSDRPSRNYYPTGQTTTFVNRLCEAGYGYVHVTDFIKRRGERSSTFLPNGESMKMYADILIEELASLLIDGGQTLHIVPTRPHALSLIKNWNVHQGLEARLNKGVISLAKEAPIFPYGTANSKEKVVESWKNALSRTHPTQ